MNIKRAIGAALLTYLASLVLGIILAISFGIEATDVNDVPTSMWLVGIALTVILAYYFAKWYFKSSKVKKGSREGLMVGIVMIITGFVLDFLFLVPTADSFSEGISSLGGYYSQIYFWITVILVLAVTSHAGKTKNET